MSNLKVEGKVADFCPKCKNCKGVTKEYDGNEFVVISGIECEDPYDGMKKILDADSDICCSMFEPKTTSPSEESRIEELIKASKRKDELIRNYREKLKELKDKYEKLDTHYQYDEAIIKDIQDIISPEDDSIWSYSEIVNEIKDLKVQPDEDKTMDKVMYEDLEYWKGRCHKAETDVTTLNSKVEVLDKRNTNQFVMIGEKDKEIEKLKKAVERRDRWVDELKSDVDTLQNEILKIRNIAQKAYDDTNRD